MSHFYRLHTVNNVSEKAPLGFRDYFRPSGNNGSYYEFEKLFEEIPLNPPWPHCKMFRAPEFPHTYIEQYDIFKNNGTRVFPDIWTGGYFTLVSQKVKDLIEAFDDFGHQFHEVPVWDRKKKPINTVPYYQMNVRRFVEIDNLGGIIPVEQQLKMFALDYYEEKYLPTLQQTPELLDKLATLPLWRHRRNHGVLYLSEDLLQRLQEAGVTGLEPYRDTYVGKPYEALARFM